MRNAWTINANGKVTNVHSVAQLHELLTDRADSDYEEVWLNSPDGAAMCMLRSGDRAVLMFLRASGASVTSRSEEGIVSSAHRQFVLANGQRDEYPEGWTVSAARARDALEDFYETGDAAGFIIWSDDDSS